VGFRANTKVTFQNEGLNELPGVVVEPRSLFHAQLALRLKSGEISNAWLSRNTLSPLNEGSKQRRGRGEQAGARFRHRR
jgi:hypothetical protein